MPKGPIKGTKKDGGGEPRGRGGKTGNKREKEKREEGEGDNTKESVRNEKEIDIQSTHTPATGRATLISLAIKAVVRFNVVPRRRPLEEDRRTCRASSRPSGGVGSFTT